MTLAPGTRLGPYEIVGQVGAGGMGEVFRAKDLKLGRDVAIKVLPVAFASDPERLRRFQQEARTLAALSHPNVVQIYDTGEHEGSPYLVMELLEGETLRQRLEQGRLQWRKAVEFAAAIADGLAAAHAKGIIHRDLKPENLVLTEHGLRILDFGLAKQWPNSLSVSSTVDTAPPGTIDGALLGTVGYMSPEQVQGKPVDTRSDIFALGCVLYEMVTGNRAFARSSTMETLAAILKDPVPELSISGSAIRVDLDRILSRCLEKTPGDRFHSAKDLSFALKNLSIADGSPPIAVPSSSNKSRWANWTWAVSVGVVLLTVGFVGWRSREPMIPMVGVLTPLPALISNARFMPDGKGVVYSAYNNEGVEELLTIVGKERPRPLNIKNASLCSVASGGELAVILHGERSPYSSGTLAVIPSGGAGAPRELAKDVNWAEWGQDGKSLAIQWSNYQGKPVEALEYPKGRLVYEAPRGHQIGRFTVSKRDGRIAFIETLGDSRQLVLIDSMGPHVFQDSGFPGVKTIEPQSLVWRDDELIAVSTDSNHMTNLVRVDLSRKKFTVIQQSLFPVRIRDAAADGRILLDGPSGGNPPILKWHQASKDSTREIQWDQSQALNALNSDGTRLLYTGQGSKLWMMKENDPVPVHLGDGLGDATFSPNEENVAVMAPAPEGDFQVRIYPLGAGSAQSLPGLWTSGELDWFPGGKQILIYNAVAKGSTEPATYIQRLDGSLPKQVEPGLAIDGPLSPDGEWCFIRESWKLNASMELFHLPTRKHESLQGKLPMPIKPMKWHRNGRGFFWIPSGSSEDGRIIHLYDRVAGKDRVVFQVPSGKTIEESIHSEIPSSDGRSFAYLVLRQPKTNLLELSWPSQTGPR